MVGLSYLYQRISHYFYRASYLFFIVSKECVLQSLHNTHGIHKIDVYKTHANQIILRNNLKILVQLSNIRLFLLPIIVSHKPMHRELKGSNIWKTKYFCGLCWLGQEKVFLT